jgi:hypothetical protein
MLDIVTSYNFFILVVVVTVAMIVVVVVDLYAYFRVEVWGKESGLYPPSGWSHRIKELDLPLG